MRHGNGMVLIYEVSQMRKNIILNEEWQFALNKGLLGMEKEGAEVLEYTPVTIPHDWMISAPINKNMPQGEAQGFFERWGIGWYKRMLWISKKQQLIYKLCFDGIYENSTIWVNNILVGGRKYGYSSFSIDITDVLQTGSNNILVKVDNTAVPADRWYSGAGIYRNVYLQILPLDHLEKEEINVQTDLNNEKATLVIRPGTKRPVRVILQQGSEEYQTENSGGVLKLEVPDYVLWSAETPVLYNLVVQLLDTMGHVGDQVSMKIGLRKVELSSEKGLFINGRSVKLKGVCLHQEAGCFGTAATKEIWTERFHELKQIGCNAIRFAHHIFMPEVLQLCDEMGFYVYEECFDKWTGGAYGRYYQNEWERDITCMVKRDCNHPCILFWGVGNEVENQAYESMLNMLENHVAKIKELDGTRLVSIAMNPHFGYPEEEVDMSEVRDIQQFVDEMKTGEIFDMDERVDRIKLIAENVDFLCCNYQEQWYDRIHKAIPDKAILGTETYMYFRGYEENFQNFSDHNPWRDVEEKDYCIGGMIWTGIDYLGESMINSAKGWSGALFSTDMEKRPIAWLYQSYWTQEPMVHFAVMDYSIPDEGIKEHWDYPRYVSHWEFPQFHKTVIPYLIATNCEQVELYVNDKQFMIKPLKAFPNRMITGFLPYLPGEVLIVGKKNGTEVCRQVLNTPGIAVKLAFDKEELFAAPGRRLLKVRAYDEEDNPVFRESARVKFMVEGPAQIVGVDNGDMQSMEPYNNDFIHLYHGKANVALHITGEGRVRVTAFAGGMKMAYTVIVTTAVRSA